MVGHSLHSLSKRVFPRLMTQVCRDPNDSAYGAADRHWWHYRMRDFSSAILQQAVYAIHVASAFPWNAPYRESLQNIVRRGGAFWNARACKHGAFEEYYPYEQGYPPLAFSTLAIAKLLKEQAIHWNDVKEGIKRAVGQLASRFENKALNQQIAGLAALGIIRSLRPDLVEETVYHSLLAKTLAYQTDEGWFPEYDGPDIGYLSVSIDCLWDLYDADPKEEILSAIEQALQYISWFVNSPFCGAGMHNARNTDYIVPYGITRGWKDQAVSHPVQNLCRDMLVNLYSEADSPDHFFSAVDDRYWSHYIGHSVFRSAQLLASEELSEPWDQEVLTEDKALKTQSGHCMLSRSGTSLLVSCLKGGICSGINARKDKRWSDYGWIIQEQGKTYVSHWWKTSWKYQTNEKGASIEGKMVLHKEHSSTPVMHITLRLLSFLLGKKLIELLKKELIFKKDDQGPLFYRTISMTCSGDVVIRDEMELSSPCSQAKRAPRSSKRHVASADSHHVEDMELLTGTLRTETVERTQKGIIITTTYHFE